MASRSTPSSFRHRLPTLSASQALSAQNSQKSHIGCGSTRLGQLLGNHGSSGNSEKQGVARGKVTEICGPPGSGKTAFAMQLAVNALLDGDKVVWIETSTPLPLPRLIHLLEHHHNLRNATSGLGETTTSDDQFDPYTTLSSLRLIRCPTLAHLLSLILYPPPHTFPEPRTTLVIVDSLSTLLSVAFPPGSESDFTSNNKERKDPSTGKWMPKQPQTQAPSAKRALTISSLAAGFSRIAVAGNVAVVVTTQMTTRVVKGVGAGLVPSIDNTQWINALSNRLFIYRDDVKRLLHNTNPPKALKERIHQIRFMSVSKAKGVSYGHEANSPPNRGQEKHYQDVPIFMVYIGEGGISDVDVDIPLSGSIGDPERGITDRSTVTGTTSHHGHINPPNPYQNRHETQRNIASHLDLRTLQPPPSPPPPPPPPPPTTARATSYIFHSPSPSPSPSSSFFPHDYPQAQAHAQLTGTAQNEVQDYTYEDGLYDEDFENEEDGGDGGDGGDANLAPVPVPAAPVGFVAATKTRQQQQQQEEEGVVLGDEEAGIQANLALKRKREIADSEDEDDEEL
ncbi:P-loop containing nucleoside triphosphate hydrolase protein [Peziza echinospora]|nr:P-loop containing nucleoside triphosphate hydrolase protein [Peziza echinospora]